MATLGIEKLSVIVADDTGSIRNIAKMILREMGFGEVEAVEDGSEALRCLENRQFQLVIADWEMPGKNGLELLEAVRKLPDEKGKAGFIMMTVNIEREKVLKAIKAGVNDYVAKPFSPEIFEGKVLGVLNKLELLPTEDASVGTSEAKDEPAKS